IQAPSELVRQFAGNNYADTDSIQKNVSIECVTSIGLFQTVTLYKNGPPVSFHSLVPHPGLFFNFSVQEVSDIDFNQYFHCEVNDLKYGSIQQSEFAFLRLTDYEIYSLHIDLMSNDMADKLAVVMLKASLLNQWAPQTYDPNFNNHSINPNLSLPLPCSSNGSTLVDLQCNLDEVVKPLQSWQIKPMHFTISLNVDRKSLVAYLYQKISDETHTIEDMNETKLVLASRAITNLFKKSQKKLPQFNVRSVHVRSIDWCWSVTLFDSITNDKYTLPKSTMGTVWKSPNLCARDRQPLVTIKCEGDKIIGLYWSSRVNPLCDYSASKYQRTNVTHSLQAVAQSNITKVNVEEIVSSTRRTILELDISTVIPEDVAYIADILQKSSDIRVHSLAAVQGMLDIAASLRNFSDHVLAESQRLGNAPNRILKSLDQLGGKVDIGPEKYYQRITSGGVGLEVWDLSRINDSTFVVGIKMLSCDKTEVLSSENLITLFRDDQVDYRHEEVAIVLHKDFIKALVSKYSGSNIRLSMNVYHDTTLFKNSVLENNISKPSLNSRVIAAHLILNGLPITNLGPYTVKIVFQPIKQSQLRANLTKCASWDFEAESGAGGWSSQGCVYKKSIDGRDVCVCDHLTNFALLTSFYDEVCPKNENEFAVTIIAIGALALSILGHLLSVLSFMLIKSVRQDRVQKIQFQLSLALLMSRVMFLVGVTQTLSNTVCIVLSVLLHYMILSSFMWMLMEGILQYLLFVNAKNTYFTNYMWKTSIPAWGLPVISVATVFIKDPELYSGGTKCCWMSLPSLIYTFVIPVGLIVLTNIIIFIMIEVSLCRRKDLIQYTSVGQNETDVNIRASFICFCVLSLPWIFGFLAIDDAPGVFQLIFCISAALQGFVIFLMMTARDKTVSAFWFSKLSLLWIYHKRIIYRGSYSFQG
ncbi:unnamed protein product, partial [Lymnaea stagnalis]